MVEAELAGTVGVAGHAQVHGVANVGPELELVVPEVLVQLLTNWNCCSLSISGQLQRLMFRAVTEIGDGAVHEEARQPEVNTSPWFKSGDAEVSRRSRALIPFMRSGLYLK